MRRGRSVILLPSRHLRRIKNAGQALYATVHLRRSDIRRFAQYPMLITTRREVSGKLEHII